MLCYKLKLSKIISEDISKDSFFKAAQTRLQSYKVSPFPSKFYCALYIQSMVNIHMGF